MADKIIPLIKTDSVSAAQQQPDIFQTDQHELLQDLINRKFSPTNTPLAGRGVKFKNVFIGSGVINADWTPVTVSTDLYSTTETNLKTYTFIANEFHPNMVVKITATGTVTMDGTRVPTIRIGTGTAPTTEWNSMVATAANVTSQPWHLVWYGIVATTGASGTMEAQMVGKINNVNKDDPNTATVALNTTVSNVFALTCQWSASTAGNSVTVRQFIVEILN